MNKIDSYEKRLGLVVGESSMQLQPESVLEDILISVEGQLRQLGLPERFATLLRSLTEGGYALAIPQNAHTYFFGYHDYANSGFEIIYIPDLVEFCLLVFRWNQELSKRTPNSQWAARRGRPYSLVDVNRMEQEFIDSGEDYDRAEILEQRLFVYDDILDYYKLNMMFGATDLDRINPTQFLERQIIMLESLWETALSEEWQPLGIATIRDSNHSIQWRKVPAVPEMESIAEIQLALTSNGSPLFMDQLHTIRWQELNQKTILLYSLQAPDYQGVFERHLSDDYVHRLSGNAFTVRRMNIAGKLNRLMRGKGAPSTRLGFISAIQLAHRLGYKKMRMKTSESGFPQHANPYTDTLYGENVTSLEWVLHKLGDELDKPVFSEGLGENEIDLDFAIKAIESSPQYEFLNFEIDIES